MNPRLPAATPEIPVRDLASASDYYKNSLGFTVDWGDADGGIIGISRDHCRMFLTSAAFREQHGNRAPVVIWLNVGSRDDVDALHAEWREKEATILAPPESKPWGLHEFTVADRDGNVLRVFYDFATPARDAREQR